MRHTSEAGPGRWGGDVLRGPVRHIHLHPLGGAAGDMVVACLLDAFPEHRDAVIRAIATVVPAECALVAHADATLTGSRFVVRDAPDGAPAGDTHHHAHPHRHWRDIRVMLVASDLDPAVRGHAIGIFAVLAEAEARVHGVPADAVAFHEVGAVDSIADIVGAAAIIAALAPATWSVASLPLGGGTVRTAHGILPVPAPATALLLEGFALHDDGIGGERVTPTGAAILRHLCRDQAGAAGGGHVPGGVLRRTGHGFGTRVLPGISNCLRALVFDVAATPAATGHRELAVISFEVDDQSGEDLALGLDRIRAAEGVHDVVQMPAFGKKSRLAVHVQVLVRPDRLEAAVRLCFEETTTIGLRTHLVQGRALPRRLVAAEVAGHAVGTKLVERPGGMVTGKAESDHLRGVAGHAARVRIRRQAEADAEAAAIATLEPTR